MCLKSHATALLFIFILSVVLTTVFFDPSDIIIQFEFEKQEFFRSATRPLPRQDDIGLAPKYGDSFIVSLQKKKVPRKILNGLHNIPFSAEKVDRIKKYSTREASREKINE